MSAALLCTSTDLLAHVFKSLLKGESVSQCPSLRQLAEGSHYDYFLLFRVDGPHKRGNHSPIVWIGLEIKYIKTTGFSSNFSQIHCLYILLFGHM